jgi:hypothetical protein
MMNPRPALRRAPLDRTNAAHIPASPTGGIGLLFGLARMQRA